MIVDIHTHTFPDKIAHSTLEKLRSACHSLPFTDGTVDGLGRSMERAGIDYSVVLPVATGPHQVVRVNDASAQLNQREQSRGILSFGCMHPDYQNWHSELSRMAQLGLRGVKLHPVYQDVDLDDIRFMRIMDRAAEVGLVVLTHAGLDIGFPGKVNCTPQMALNACRQLGPIPLILAHMGGWRNWDQVEQLLADTGVFLDTSFCLGRIAAMDDGYYSPADTALMGDDQFMRMVRAFGARRILFGSDSPWGGQAEDLSNLRALPLTGEELDNILGGNAQRLLGL